MSRLVYVLPVHNEERHLVGNVTRLASYLERIPGSEVFLVENGSHDASWDLGRQLASGSDSSANVPVRAFREPNAGIGYAYHRGLTEALSRFGPSTRWWAVLTGADLPFGSSDLEAALVALDRSESRILIGSKAHPDSRANTGAKRRLMSSMYRVARRLVVGMKVGDSQGSVFVRLDLAAELLPRVEARGFFYSTELCHFAERAGETILELPVVLEASQRASTVRPAADGLTMARELWRLRKRG
jgi:glycosyltransferase involved in cell wall biosynthesis